MLLALFLFTVTVSLYSSPVPKVSWAYFYAPKWRKLSDISSSKRSRKRNFFSRYASLFTILKRDYSGKERHPYRTGVPRIWGEALG